MSIFTNKSAVELIPQNEINSDFGVLLFRSASFNKFDKSKYQNADGTPNDLAVKKIYECLIHKHRSVFFGSVIHIGDLIPLSFCDDITTLSKNDMMGLWYEGRNECTISIFLALKWIYKAPTYFDDDLIEAIERRVQQMYPACYKALKMLPDNDITSGEKSFLEMQVNKFISFKSELPIFIARQLYRSRGINFTERSGRYTAENIRFFKPDAWRKAPEKATQGSIENKFSKEIGITTHEGDIATKHFYSALVEYNEHWYETNLENGMCKEQARMILPQSQITTTINTVDLYTLTSVLSQRLDKHAQLEIREVAQQLYDIACNEFGKELVDRLIDIQTRLVF